MTRLYLMLPLVLMIAGKVSAAALPAVDVGNLAGTPSGTQHFAGAYLTGFEGFFTTIERRSYIIFNVSNLSSSYTSATMNLWSPEPAPINNFTGGYRSDRDEEIFKVYEVSMPAIDLLNMPNGQSGVVVDDAWEDLGDGNAFGSVVMTEANEASPGQNIEIPLNVDALLSIKEADGIWAVGGIVIEGEIPFASGNWQLYGGASPFYHDPQHRTPVPTIQTFNADFNRNGIVDAADYTIWRDSFGSTTELAADGNDDGVIDSLDYDLFVADFGKLAIQAEAGILVPEPASSVALLPAIAALLAVRWARSLS